MDSGCCEPFEPFPESLEKNYDKLSLMAVWEKLERLTAVVNPQPEKISKEEMFALMAAIAKVRNISPLAVFGPDAQNSFIVTMVDLLVNSMERKSSSEQSEPSTQG